jgi:hypothetical protein
MTRFTLIALFGVLASCAGSRTDQQPPDRVVGKYAFQASGSIAKHPWNANAVLLLERDAQYTLDFRFLVDDETEHETGYGTYRVDGDKLFLEPADGTEMDDLDEFTIQGNRLVPKLAWPAKLLAKGLKVNPVFVKAE